MSRIAVEYGSSIALHDLMRARHPQHLHSFDYIGLHRYSLRFCTDSRTPVFTEAATVELVWRQFLRAATEQLFAIVVYCFMPDHVHLLVEGTREDADLKRFQAAAKQYSGFYYSRQFGRPLWQRYGYERVLRSAEPTLLVARYVLENPIRAGLTTTVTEYPFIGSSVYTLEELIDAVQIAESG